MDRLISCTMAAEMMRAKADMAAPEYKMPFEVAAMVFDLLAAAWKKSDPLIRRMDDLGRVAIPKEFRERLGIQEGDALEIEVDGPSGAIVMRKAKAQGGLNHGTRNRDYPVFHLRGVRVGAVQEEVGGKV